MKAGPVPKHIAFIMDGNRRFANRHQQVTTAGHQFGYYKLLDALEWCLEIGITCVSAYAFSIDNFKRPGDEVDMLMRLAEEKLEELLHRDLVERHGVQVRVLGDLSLLPASVQAAAKRAMDSTKLHTRGILNICFSYGSRQEMAQAVGKVQDGVMSGALCPDDVSPNDIEQHLYTEGCPPVDLLIRTSGETRLSDFLCWQVRHAQLVFADVLWPDFSFYDLLRALLQFQMASTHLKSLQALPPAL
ncbi:Di-trans-poly-cis-decaprenylcistransferase [Coccomyxa subellipsoidea C-169]|uniref:Alkyl transferase n=1 Tax=Coccomyxa subellipsoidea (strain C-169) TaxID=574566 RepID=I0ZAK8_COCSC|nr:Di-trans-poly-cis-decaprenylcistransferase [Coccomyxa subellipsoidea C-169]EIE27677.1 Di-trans-poly-cis-decaprenylcistransferase [Coccomyxa subellipsoidea C-169]|eukprot:XP_005652221.1 Di-trans-poly-cis-decaprenylcistransferase [Coccomyxa subellipsoidea C-169]